MTGVPSATDWLLIDASTGTELPSVTVIVKLVSAVAPPLSVTRIVTGCVPGPSASPGVHENAPVFATMLAPIGAVTRLYVRVCAGRSASVALAVAVTGVPSATD